MGCAPLRPQTRRSRPPLLSPSRSNRLQLRPNVQRNPRRNLAEQHRNLEQQRPSAVSNR